VFSPWLRKGYDIRPTIAVTKAHIDLPEVREAVRVGRLIPDGKVLSKEGQSFITKVRGGGGGWVVLRYCIRCSGVPWCVSRKYCCPDLPWRRTARSNCRYCCTSVISWTRQCCELLPHHGHRLMASAAAAAAVVIVASPRSLFHHLAGRMGTCLAGRLPLSSVR